MSIATRIARALSTKSDDAAVEHLTGIFKSRFGGEVLPSERAISSVVRNITGEVESEVATNLQNYVAGGYKNFSEEQLFRGVTNASESQGNILTAAFNTTEGGAGGLGGMLMGVGIGAIGASATGGDFREGAAVGAVAGFGISSAGRAIARNITNVEQNFMSSLLKGVREQPTAVSGSMDDVATSMSKNVENLTFDEMISAGYGERTAREIFDVDDDAIRGMYQTQKNAGIFDDTVTEAEYIAGFDTKLNAMDLNRRGDSIIRKNFEGVDPSTLDTTRTLQGSRGGGPLDLSAMSRDQKLNAITNLNSAQLKEAGFGAKYKQDVLMGRKDLNVARATRIAGFTGTALSGMAFSSRRRDHRRGFNKRRGNRV